MPYLEMESKKKKIHNDGYTKPQGFRYTKILRWSESKKKKKEKYLLKTGLIRLIINLKGNKWS